MPDDDTEDLDEYEDDESPLGRTVKNLRKQLKQAHKDLAAAQEGSKRAEDAERRVAVLEAGLNLKPAQMKALQAAHEGEWTAEAVRATAVDLGWASPPEDGAKKDELDALGRMNDAAKGGLPPDHPDALSELEGIDESDPDFVERVMSTVAKHGGNTTWVNQ